MRRARRARTCSSRVNSPSHHAASSELEQRIWPSGSAARHRAGPKRGPQIPRRGAGFTERFQCGIPILPPASAADRYWHDREHDQPAMQLQRSVSAPCSTKHIRYPSRIEGIIANCGCASEIENSNSLRARDGVDEIESVACALRKPLRRRRVLWVGRRRRDQGAVGVLPGTGGTPIPRSEWAVASARAGVVHGRRRRHDRKGELGPGVVVLFTREYGPQALGDQPVQFGKGIVRRVEDRIVPRKVEPVRVRLDSVQHGPEKRAESGRR